MGKRIGIIGLGRMGLRTVQAAQQAGMEVVAILDSSDNPWGAQQDPSLREILHADADSFHAEQPEVVAISTPATHHVSLLQDALQRGVKHVMVEKPLACSVREARQALELAQAHGARVAVNHGKRYAPLFKRIRALSGTREMGTLRSVYIAMGCSGYGCVGTHYFDLMNWMFDAQPVRVMAVGTTPDSPNPRGEWFDDAGGAVLLEYPGKRRGIVELGDDIGVVGGMEFRFEYGFLTLENEAALPVQKQRTPEVRDRPKSAYGAPLESVPWEPYEVFDAVRATRAVLEELVSDAPITAGLEAGIASTEIFIAARLAGERQQAVELPLRDADLEAYYPVP